MRVNGSSPASRGAVAATALALAGFGAAWSGCGDSGDDAADKALEQSKTIQENVQTQIDEATKQAQKQAKEIQKDVQGQVNNAQKQAQKQADQYTK